jgi:hypothetical protein
MLCAYPLPPQTAAEVAEKHALELQRLSQERAKLQVRGLAGWLAGEHGLQQLLREHRITFLCRTIEQ